MCIYIVLVLVLDLYWYGIGFGLVLVLYWYWIGIGLVLVLDWCWIGIGLVLNWYWIGLVLDWYWIGGPMGPSKGISIKGIEVSLCFVFFMFPSRPPNDLDLNCIWRMLENPSSLPKGLVIS